MGTTCGMMVADGFGTQVGIVLHKHIPEKAVKWVAADCFAGFGLLGLHDALDQFLANGATAHHPFLLAGVVALLTAMWAVSRLTSANLTSQAVPEAAAEGSETRS